MFKNYKDLFCPKCNEKLLALSYKMPNSYYCLSCKQYSDINNAIEHNKKRILLKEIINVSNV